jgi:hypothetical protein
VRQVPAGPPGGATFPQASSGLAGVLLQRGPPLVSQSGGTAVPLVKARTARSAR